MAKQTSAQMAAKWQRNYVASAEQMKQGANAVTEAPTAAALRAKDRYFAGVTRAFNDGTYERGLQNSTLADWKTAYIEKGIANAAAGAKLGAVKWDRHEREFGPKRDQIIAGLPPKGGKEENIARMVAYVRAMGETKGS